RGAGQRHRSAGSGEALDELAVEQRAAQCRQKRRPGGNRKDSRRAMAHARVLCGARGKASGSALKSCGQPFPRALVAGNAKSQPLPFAGKGAREDPGCEQPLEGAARVVMRGQPEQTRSAEDPPAGPLEEHVEPRALLAEAPARRLQPIRIGEGADPDRDRRPADRPRPQRRTQWLGDVGGSEREAETKASEPVSLAERAKDDRAARRQHWRKTFLGVRSQLHLGSVDAVSAPAPSCGGGHSPSNRRAFFRTPYEWGVARTEEIVERAATAPSRRRMAR